MRTEASEGGVVDFNKWIFEGRMKVYKLTLHPVKTKIINLQGWSEKQYPRKYDFSGVQHKTGHA